VNSVTDNLTAWLHLLDQFEKAVDAAEESLDVHGDFQEPPGPVPDELRERAEAVLARQKLLINTALTSRAKVARELAALRRVPTTQSDVPAYLDVEG
jgi:hypothetical protein